MREREVGRVREKETKNEGEKEREIEREGGLRIAKALRIVI